MTKEGTICQINGTKLHFYIESRKEAKKLLNIFNSTIGNNKFNLIYKKDGVTTMTMMWKPYNSTISDIRNLKENNLHNATILLKVAGLFNGINEYLGCTVMYENVNKERVMKELRESLEAA